MFKKFIKTILVLTCFMLAATGCGMKTTENQSENGKRIAVLVHTNDDALIRKLISSIKDAASEKGATVDVYNSEQNSEKQIKQLKKAVKKRYDAILIKDNHIAVAGGVKEALARAQAYASHMTKIEIEVESLAQAREAVEGGADVIMLDNMAPEAMKECVEMIQHRAVVEASGGIDEHNLEAAAAAGVDVISIGALTHSVKALDISLDVGEIK